MGLSLKLDAKSAITAITMHNFRVFSTPFDSDRMEGWWRSMMVGTLKDAAILGAWNRGVVFSCEFEAFSGSGGNALATVWPPLWFKRSSHCTDSVLATASILSRPVRRPEAEMGVPFDIMPGRTGRRHNRPCRPSVRAVLYSSTAKVLGHA